MAVGSPKSVLEIDLDGLMSGDEDDFGISDETGERFEIELEEELQHDFDLHTLVKANATNYTEYSKRYNIICQELMKVGDEAGVNRLLDLRFQARRAALDGVSLTLACSPFTDDGAAICYGYVEGAQELARSMYSAASDETKIMPMSSIDLVHGKI